MTQHTPLDRIDRAIVAALQKDGRQSNKELAAAVGLSPSSCHERVKRLKDAGVVRRFGAVVDPAALGIGLEAMVAVRLGRHSRALVDAFIAEITTLPEVVGLYHVTGAHDFLVHVNVRDAEHLRNLVLDAFTTREELAQVETSLVFTAWHAESLPDLLLP